MTEERFEALTKTKDVLQHYTKKGYNFGKLDTRLLLGFYLANEKV
jgi:hypothetical protein